MSLTAGKLRVLIATTNGPVEVQLLTEEDAIIGRCVACIGGTTETADIASAYHAFVVRPTGVIEARFGHSCYRLDVSGRIDAGSSWQLGVLAAHALLAAGRLAQENDVADGVLWATGSVRPVDLTVGAVSHVPDKLANSLDRLKGEREAGCAVLLAVPAGNAADASSAEAEKELSAVGAEFITVSHAQALFDALGMTLPEAPSKGSVPTGSAAAVPQAAVSAKPRRRVFAWTAAAVLIGIVGAGAFVLSDVPRARMLLSEIRGVVTPPAPIETPAPVSTPASEPVQQAQPVQPARRGAELVPETIPFITATERQRVRNEYLPAPDYKALAMTMYDVYFVRGQTSQESADKAAMEACESSKRRPSSETSLTEIEYRCDLYASGNVVVSQRTNIAMPPQPWINASVQRPFVSAELPMVSQERKDLAERRYRRYPSPKALIISVAGRAFYQSGQSSPEEAMRRSLERCGYTSGAACLVVAVDDTFVIAAPTLAKAVGFYRPDSLFGVAAEERAEIARRLATSSEGWHAVALGATRHAGTKVGANSERSAVDGALENCALYDRDCRIAVIGPFMVQPLSGPAPANLPAPAVTPTPAASPTPPVAVPPPEASTPPAVVIPAPPSASNAPKPPVSAGPSAPPASPAPRPSASAVPPAVRPPPEIRTTKQTDIER